MIQFLTAFGGIAALMAAAFYAGIQRERHSEQGQEAELLKGGE